MKGGYVNIFLVRLKTCLWLLNVLKGRWKLRECKLKSLLKVSLHMTQNVRALSGIYNE